MVLVPAQVNPEELHAAARAAVLATFRWTSARARVRELVEMCGAPFLGCALVVDQLEDATRARLGRVVGIVRAAELGPSG